MVIYTAKLIYPLIVLKKPQDIATSTRQLFIKCLKTTRQNTTYLKSPSVVAVKKFVTIRAFD